MLFKVFFYLQGSHAAGAGSGDGLAVAAVLNVAAGVDAREEFAVQRAVDVILGEDVVVFVEIHEAFECLGVGDVANAEEHEGDGQDGFDAGGGVFEA